MPYCTDPIMFLINFIIQHPVTTFTIIMLMFLGIIKIIEVLTGKVIINE